MFLKSVKHLKVGRNNPQASDDSNNSLDKVYQRVTEFIAQLIPCAQLIRETNGNFTYMVKGRGFRPSKVYRSIEANKERLNIADWGLSQTTLENVFKKICE